MSLQQILMATGGGSSLDPDAQAFITAAGITDATQKTAINDLVVGLKADSLWTKIVALYPFVGGTAASHAVNAKTPGTYNITWNGAGFTHDANGVTSDGSTGTYGDTGLVAGSVFTGVDQHIGIYQRDDTRSSIFHVGCGNYDGVNLAYFNLNTGRPTSNQALYYDGTGVNDGANSIFANIATNAGFTVGTRRAINDANVYKNGVSLVHSTGTATNNLPGTPGTIGILGTILNISGTPSPNYLPANLSLVSIGKGLTDTDVANLYTAVQAFQTSLGRQV